MRLGAKCSAVDRWASADVGDRAIVLLTDLGSCCVNAAREYLSACLEGLVYRGKSERSAEVLTVDHGAFYRIVSREQIVRSSDVAIEQKSAYCGRAYSLAVNDDLVDNGKSDAVSLAELFEQLHVALTTSSEAVVVATDDVRRSELLYQMIAEEIFGR